MKKLVFIAASTLVIGLGCGGENNETNNGTNNGGTDGIQGGDYTVTVEDVTDGCFDGAMDTIVLPDGSPRDLPEPVTIPASGDLPATIDINFNDPFQDVTGVEVEAAGNNGIQTAADGFVQQDVNITNDGTGDCLATMNVTFELTQAEPGSLTGSGTLSITEATGADCPAFTAGPPCEVVSNLTATRN